MLLSREDLGQQGLGDVLETDLAQPAPDRHRPDAISRGRVQAAMRHRIGNLDPGEPEIGWNFADPQQHALLKMRSAASRNAA